MKKILVLNGAGKKNGNTAGLIEAFKTGAESAGNEVKEFYLHSMNIKGCMDCQGCARKPKGDRAPCVQKDDMQQIYTTIISLQSTIVKVVSNGSTLRKGRSHR